MKLLSAIKKTMSSLRMRLMLLVLLAVLPAFAMIFYTEEQHSQMADQHMHDDIRQLVHIGISKYSSLLSDTRQMLQTLSYLPEVTQEQSEACNRMFASLKSGYPYYANIGANSASGKIICSAVPVRHKVNAAKHSWFQKALASGDFVISDFHVGGITGIPVIVTALGRKDTGKVVVAAIDLHLLNHWIGSQHLEKTTVVMLLDSHGVVLTHYPQHKDWVGRSLAGSELVTKILASDGEGSFEGTGVDGVSRIYDFAPLNAGAKHRIYIVACIERNTISSQIELIRNKTLAGFSLVVLFVLIISWYGSEFLLLRRLQAVVSAAGRLAGGNLKTRTGLKHDNNDIGNLARAFDDMAATLEKQTCERTQLTNELRASETKLRNMVGDLQRTREEERKLIAQDIHDEVGGMLAALKMDINLLSRKLNNNEGSAKDMLGKVSEHVDMLMQFVRRIITNLRPSVLDNLGLVEAIEWQLTEFKNRYNVEVTIDEFLPEGDIVFEDETYSSSLFRIFQEIMTNIAKHSGAVVVNIFVGMINEEFILSVSDNGCGLDEQSRKKVGALGILSIEERVHSMNGECAFLSKQNIGTTITVKVPLVP